MVVCKRKANGRCLQLFFNFFQCDKFYFLTVLRLSFAITIKILSIIFKKNKKKINFTFFTKVLTHKIACYALQLRILQLPHKEPYQLTANLRSLVTCSFNWVTYILSFVYSLFKTAPRFQHTGDLFKLDNRVIVIFACFVSLIWFFFADTSIGYFSSEGSNRRLGEFCFGQF